MTASTDSGPVSGARIAAWVFIITGAAFPLGVVLGLDAGLAFFVDLVFWPLDGAQNVATPEARLLASIAGGVIAGWGYTLLLLARHGLAEQGSEGWAWRAAMGGLLLWFALDGIGSIASGAWANVIGNLSFLFVLGIPLWLMRSRAAAKSPA